MNQRPQCPKCESNRTYKNGSNTLCDGIIVQRYFCQDCRKTFQQRRGVKRIAQCPFCLSIETNQNGGSVLSDGTPILYWICQICQKTFHQIKC